MKTKTATMSISLPLSLKKYVKTQVREEYYSTPSDYIRSLIRDDIRQKERSRLDNLLLQGLKSKSRGMDIKTWRKLKSEILNQVK